MSNETFFRMLSIAFLGAIALAFVPDTQADSGALPMTPVAQVAPIEIEIESLQQIEAINAGRFNPALAGDMEAFANSAEKTEISALTTGF